MSRELLLVRDALLRINSERTLKSDKARRHWIRSRLTRVRGENPPSLDYSYIVKHAADVGIAVQVESALNLTRGKLCFPVLSISPPGGLYRPGAPLPPQEGCEGLGCTALAADDLVWDSMACTRNGPVWHTAAPVVLRTFDIPVNGVLVIDLRILEIKGGAASMADDAQGFALLPLSSMDGFVRHGRFQIPVFAGAPPVQVLERVQIDGCATPTHRDTRPLLAADPQLQAIGHSGRRRTARREVRGRRQHHRPYRRPPAVRQHRAGGPHRHIRAAERQALPHAGQVETHQRGAAKGHRARDGPHVRKSRVSGTVRLVRSLQGIRQLAAPRPCCQHKCDGNKSKRWKRPPSSSTATGSKRCCPSTGCTRSS